MISKKDFVVVGAGFKGMMAAYKLSEMGYKVTLIDMAKNIGGVLNSPTWNNMNIDLGCHLFSNQGNENFTKDIINILSNEILKVSTSYSSFFQNKKTNDIAIPDFESLNRDDKNKIYHSLLNPSESISSVTSLEDFYVNRFGEEASKWINNFVKKAYGINSARLCKIANRQLPFNRIRIFPLKKALKLKESKFYDDRIAVPRITNNLISSKENFFSFNEYYPSRGGLQFFCKKLEQKLIKNGVKFMLGNSIESIFADEKFNIKIQGSILKSTYIYWAAPQYQLSNLFNIPINLKEFLFDVPLMLYYFTVERDMVSKENYIQNFDFDFNIYRASIQSNYADNNIPANIALICCEVPVNIGSELWNESEKYSQIIWEELFNMGIVFKSNYLNKKIIKTTAAYKLPLKGYLKAFNSLKQEVIKERIFGISDWDYSKNDIMSNIYNDLSKLK